MMAHCTTPFSTLRPILFLWTGCAWMRVEGMRGADKSSQWTCKSRPNKADIPGTHTLVFGHGCGVVEACFVQRWTWTCCFTVMP